jgi:phenylalanyl-tRNA synthetase beta chain
LHGSAGSAAARRFAWELSPELVPLALARACRLLREHAGAKIEGVVDRYPRPRPRVNVRMRFSDMPRVLGIDVAPEETLDILRRLQFTAATDGDTLIATPPVVRTDIAIAEDIVEEVGRIAGYDRLPTRVPDGPLPLAERHPFEDFRERTRDALAGFGLQEIVAYSLIDPAWLRMLAADDACVAPEPLHVVNPTTVAQSAARPTLRASLLDTARRNLRHRDGLAIFEIAPVYLPRRGDLPDERPTVAILLAGEALPVKEGETWLVGERKWDLRDIQGMVQGLADLLRVRVGGEEARAPGMHPGRSLALAKDGVTHLVWGQLDPRISRMWELPDETFVAEIDLASWHRAAQPVKIVPPPRYPAARRDLAVVVSETTSYAAVEEAIRSAAGRELESLGLLDIYRGAQVGEGRKSLAVRLVLRSATATLADADVDRVVRRIAGRLQHEVSATIR